MAEHVRIYEEKKATSTWLWLLPLLLLLALLAFFLVHRSHNRNGVVSTSTSASTALPEIGSIHFETNSAALTEDGKQTLNQAATALKANPAAHLRIEGFTDSTGTASANDVLSQHRAASAADYLKSLGIDGSRLTGQGFGPTDPVASNATSPGRADNRRAELFIQK